MITPREKRTARPLTYLLLNQSLIYCGSMLVPCSNARLIRRHGSIALWIPDVDGPVRLVLDVALADFLAKPHQILFSHPLSIMKKTSTSLSALIACTVT